MNMKAVLVTGGNRGLGLAVCRLLVRDHGCFVYMGSRDLQRGREAVNSIKEMVGPEKSGNIEVIQIDVCCDESIANAANKLKSQGVCLSGLVNNAGVGGYTAKRVKFPEDIMETNFYGPKKVTDAFLSLLDPRVGRIVNVSSDGAVMWLKNQSDKTKKLFSDPHLTWDALDATMRELVALVVSKSSALLYYMSKGGLNALTLAQAHRSPNLTVTCVNPGFLDTKITKGAAALYIDKWTPEQGARPVIKCLLGNVESGCFYGCDGLRSPFLISRDLGTPEYQGEENPNPKTYLWY